MERRNKMDEIMRKLDVEKFLEECKRKKREEEEAKKQQEAKKVKEKKD